MCTHRYTRECILYVPWRRERGGEKSAIPWSPPTPISVSLCLSRKLSRICLSATTATAEEECLQHWNRSRERERQRKRRRRYANSEGGGQTSPPYSPSALRARSRTYFFFRYIPGGAPSRSCTLSSWRFLDLIFILSLSAGPRYPPAASRSFSLSLSLSPYYVCSVLAQFPEPPFPSTSASTSPPPSARVRIYSRSSPHSIVSVSLPTSLLTHSLSHFAYARYTLLLVCSAQQLLQQQQQQRVQRENEKERQLGVYI